MIAHIPRLLWIWKLPSHGSFSLQELYRWPKVAEAARYALGIRYSLLPYLYTSFRTTASHGCPLARPLMLGWPGDPAARTSDRQWTMGDAVLVTPVLDQARSCLFSPCLRTALASPHASRPLMLT